MPLVEHPANDIVLGWAPDGKWVLFTSDRADTSVPGSYRWSMGNPAEPLNWSSPT